VQRYAKILNYANILRILFIKNVFLRIFGNKAEGTQSTKGVMGYGVRGMGMRQQLDGQE